MSERSYTLFGASPDQVEQPETVAEAQEIVRQAAGKAIVPWGGGARQHIGHAPERYDVALSTERLRSILDHQPADMTVTAQAGTTVAELQQTLARHGQFLPLDVAAPEQQTLGGIIAARADSLRRFSLGSVRDSLLGVSVINAQGELIKGGGKVVKNVSGYDLPKMYCGSFGTLGLIAEATFKVAPLPQASATLVMTLAADRNTEDALDALMDAGLEPAFIALLDPAAGELIGLTAGAQCLVIGFDGAAEAVEWQAEALQNAAVRLPDASAQELRTFLRDFALMPAPMTAAFHILSSQIGAFARMVEWTARRAGFSARVAADAAVGMLWAHFEPLDDTRDWRIFYQDLKDKADRVGGSFIIERMPEALRAVDTPVWSPLLSDFALMVRLKKTLDPQRAWNPGRFVGRL